MVDISAGDGEADGYLVLPDGPGPHPGVLMYQDLFGIRPRLVEMADRIADRGYAVLVPNLLYRGGPAPQFELSELSKLNSPSRRDRLFERIFPYVVALNADRIIRDTGAYLDFFAAQKGVAPGPVAIVGYCMGGMNALRAIEAYPDRITALASFHAGRLVTDWPDSPHLSVGDITGEVYFAHAEWDRSMGREEIRTLEVRLGVADVSYRSEVYEGTQHGFTMADTPAYQEAGEQRHWVNLFDLLDRALPLPQR
jgi:carboxymethylenebutenolidase